MSWYINDLSLAGQYQNTAAFLDDLKILMRQREQSPILRQKLYCSSTLHSLPVTSTDSFREAVFRDKSVAQPVLAWLSKYGPFWDDNREQNPDDYFECNDNDVTDQGLGEAARCLLHGRASISVSFPNGGFNYSPVVIVQGLPEEPLASIPIQNIWELSLLQGSVLASIPLPRNWHQMLEQVEMRFDRLVFSPQSIDELTLQPFSVSVVERIFELLRVLNEFMHCRNEDGTYTAKNQELINQYFSGSKAWFTDESDTNKQNFVKEMSFQDFECQGEKIFCSWHGKIKSPQYRIHFEWPVRLRSKLRIFYIGPKITKG